jgi:hypothetical protein
MMAGRVLGPGFYRVDINNFEHGVRVQEFLELRSALELVVRSLPDSPREWAVQDGMLYVHAPSAGLDKDFLVVLSHYQQAPLPPEEQLELLRVAEFARSAGEQVITDDSEAVRTGGELSDGTDEAFRLRVLQSGRIWPSLEEFLVSAETAAGGAEG